MHALQYFLPQYDVAYNVCLLDTIIWKICINCSGIYDDAKAGKVTSLYCHCHPWLCNFGIGNMESKVLIAVPEPGAGV